MNKDIAEGKWKQIKGSIQETWGDFTDDEIDEMKGSQEKFEGKMQERYGKSKDEAREAWERLTGTH